MIEIKAPAATQQAPSDASRFTPLQWLVIAIGLRPETLPLHYSPFGQALFGLVGCGEMECPCLETLRHTACIAGRCGWGIPRAFPDLIESGGVPMAFDVWFMMVAGGEVGRHVESLVG